MDPRLMRWLLALALGAVLAGCGSGSTGPTAGSGGGTYTVVGVPPRDSMQSCFAEQAGEKPDREVFEECVQEAAGPPETGRCDSTFDSDAWDARSATAGELPTDRQKVADQIVQCKLLAGNTRAEVTDQLGKPDDYLYGNEPRYDTWTLGTERGFVPIDNEHLVVKYDDQDRVERVRIQTD